MKAAQITGLPGPVAIDDLVQMSGASPAVLFELGRAGHLKRHHGGPVSLLWPSVRSSKRTRAASICL